MNEHKLRSKSYKLQVTSSKRQDKNLFSVFFKRLRFIDRNSHVSTRCSLLVACSLWLAASSCGVYTFKDVSIPPEVKTVKINYIENKARYINPQLSPQLTDALTQKISNQTKLTRTQNDDADWQISGTITNYSVSFSAVSGTQTTQNNLTVGVHIVFRDNQKDKTDEFDVSRDFPFSASLSLPQAEGSLQAQIIKNVSDEIFNHIFSNW